MYMDARCIGTSGGRAMWAGNDWCTSQIYTSLLKKNFFLCAAVLRRACTSKEPTKWCHPMAIRIFRKMMSAIHLGEVFVQETEQLISFVLCYMRAICVVTHVSRIHVPGEC